MCQAMLTLQNDEKTLTFKVKAEWEANSFDLTVFADEAWHVHISEDDIERFASERNLSFKDYYDTLREYLSDVDQKVSFNLKYEKNTDEDDGVADAEFTISRKTGARVLLYFSSKLKKVNFQQCIYGILDDLIEKHNDLTKRVQELQREKLEIEKEKNIYEDKLIEFIERKSKWEQEMYSNFLLLLNEKKKRIKFLTGILKRKNIDPNEIVTERNPEDLPSKKKNKRSGRIEELSESESSNYSEDTEEYDTESNGDSERHEPTPSTSRQELDLDEPAGDGSHLLLPKRTREIEDDEGGDTVLLKTSDNEKAQVSEESGDPLTPQLEFSTQDLIDRM